MTKNYTVTDRLQAVALSDIIGAQAAADQLQIPINTLKWWRCRKQRERIAKLDKHNATIVAQQRRIYELEQTVEHLRQSNKLLVDALAHVNNGQATP
jgi:transposase-like protein